MNKNTKLWIGIIATLVVVLLVAGYFIFKQRGDMEDMVQQFDIQKEELEDEYADLAVQYESYKFNVNNDSLLQQLDTEQMKVQRLQEELRTVKSTNSRRINELKKELNLLRSVMRIYVRQIDSLNQLNKKLEQENITVSKKYQEASRTATQLKKEKQALTEQVTLAAKLDAVGITAEPIDKRGKKASKISRTEQLKFCFTLAKNATAQPGEKYIYICIFKPDGEMLMKNRSDTFRYQDRDVNFSSRKLVEYEGEEMPICIFWTVEEFLYPGDYRVDIFADGYIIGSRTFTLSK